MNEEKALEIFKKNISAKPNKIERCGIGHGNYVYIISCEIDKYVIRLSSEDNAYADTVYWLRRLRKINIPVPEVLADGKYENYNYIILSYIDGDDLGTVYNDLSSEEKRLIAKEVVAIQNAVAGLKLENIEVGWTWNSFIKYMLDRASERIEMNGYFDTDKVRRLWKMSEPLREYFERVKPTAYLDDISTKNLLIKNGRVSGIIDVDWMGVGDKLTFAAMSNVALLNMDCDTYYIDCLLNEMNIDLTERKAFVFYSLLFCVDFMGERGMTFGDKKIDVNKEIIERLNRIYDTLIIDWNNLNR